MNELEFALKWLGIGQQVLQAGEGAWAAIKATLAEQGITGDTEALDRVIADAARRKALAEQDATGGGQN